MGVVGFGCLIAYESPPPSKFRGDALAANRISTKQLASDDSISRVLQMADSAPVPAVSFGYISTTNQCKATKLSQDSCNGNKSTLWKLENLSPILLIMAVISLVLVMGLVFSEPTSQTTSHHIATVFILEYQFKKNNNNGK